MKEFSIHLLRRLGFMPEFTDLTPRDEGLRLTCYALDQDKPAPNDDTPADQLPVMKLGLSVLLTPGQDVELHRAELADRVYRDIWKRRLIGWADPYHGYPQYEMKLRQGLHHWRTHGYPSKIKGE